MKINFSLHIRYFITGIIISVPLLFFMYSLPEYENELLEDITEDTETFGIFIILFLIFFSYCIGIISEIISRPLRESTELANHLKTFLNFFNEKDTIVQRSQLYKSIYQTDTKEGLGNLEVYKYMITFITFKSEPLNKEIQYCFFRIHIIAALYIACILLSLTFLSLLITSDYNEEYIPGCILSFIFFLGGVVLYNVRHKAQKNLLDTIERAYYILMKYDPQHNTECTKEEKIDIEL